MSLHATSTTVSRTDGLQQARAVLYQPSPSGSRAARAARVRCRLALERCVRHSALPACALQCAGTLGSPPRQWRHADTGASHAKQ